MNPSSPSTVLGHSVALRKARAVARWARLVASGFSTVAAAQAVRAEEPVASLSSLWRWARILAAEGHAGLVDRRRGRVGRKRSALRLTDAEAAAIQALVLQTNRTEDSGSVPEALRIAARNGQVREEIASEWRDRERDGRGVPDALRREVGVPAAVVRQHRAPTEAGLQYLCAPGSSRWLDDPAAPGGRRFVQVGEVLEADDATINFYACVPWEPRGCPVSERYGVKLGRFQWLVAIDRSSLYVPGYSYTCRPRDSYRAEDVVGLFNVVFRQHGVWSHLCLERGVWESDRVETLIDGLGIERMTAWSPRQKPYIEGLFNLLWTKLSLVPGQVGRHRAEEERIQPVVRSCQTGATDPRLHFPMLADVLDAMRQAVAERNSQPVHSPEYGTWVPEERWLAQQAEARERGCLRPLAAETAWMFAPCVRDWAVRGGRVGGSVQLMEGFSVPFSFTSEALPLHEGRRVRAFFDHSAPACNATLVLLENSGDLRAGDVLGQAFQIDEMASYARQVMAWGLDDREAGRKARLANAAALRRHATAILPGGRVGVQTTDLRDGLGQSLTVERGAGEGDAAQPAPAPAPVRRRSLNPLAPSSPEEFRRRGSLLETLAASAREDATVSVVMDD